MSFRRFLFCLFLVCGGMVVSSCLESTPPTPVFGDLQLGVRSSPAESSLLGGVITLDEVRLNLRRVDFIPEKIADPGVDYAGPFVLNLVQAGEVVDQETPSFDFLSLEADTYHQIRFRIDNLDAEEVPSELAADEVVQSFLVDNSVVMEGSFEESESNDMDGSGGVSEIPFRFVSNMIVNLKLDLPAPFLIVTGETRFIFLAIRLPFWFETVLEELQGLSSSDLTEGRVLLVDDSDSRGVREIANLMEDAIKQGTKFAQSSDNQFEEDEVDEDSGSEIDFSSSP